MVSHTALASGLRFDGQPHYTS